jgi:hypothetical protein
MADVIVQHLFKRQVFSWGMNRPFETIDVRTTYIRSLRMADEGLIAPLLEFARS